MKDLEKIKSEDLAAQVQDANPANFAIEQEVAQLVGATVPQPTEPSADDARELGAQLLVFLRRALTPIQTALRTALAAIYAHLDSRCTDYTPAAYAPYRLLPPYDPMGTPPTPRTLPNLLTALTAFSARKISGVPEAADGISLVHLLFGAYADIEELTDDNEDWGAPRQISIMSLFPNLKKLTLGISSLNWMLLDGATGITEFHLPYLKTLGYGYPFRNSFAATCELNFPELYTASFGSNFSPCIQGCGFKKFQADKMHDIRSSGSNSPFLYNCPNLEEIILPSLAYCNHWAITLKGGGLANNCPKLWKVVVGDLSDTSITGYQGSSGNGMGFPDCPKLIHLELGANGVDVSVSVDMRWWEPDSETLANPLFLVNFKTYIALRLTSNGSGKTLTLSQAVFSAVIEGSSPICDDIKGIIEDKGWKVQDTNNNIFPTT